MEKLINFFTAIILTCLACQYTTAQTCTGNLITNSGFENGLTGWTTTGDVTISSTAHSGSKAANVGGTGYGSVGFILPASVGTAYSANLWAKQTGTTYKIAELRFLNSAWSALPGSVGQDIPSSGYTELTLSGTAPTGTAYVYVIASKDGNGSIEVDDVCLTVGSGGGGSCSPDLTPPVISGCPTSIIQTTTGSSATASWAAPTATDNCTATPTLSSNYNPGASFQLGTTNVIYTATDAAGNTANCTFNVTVNQTTGGGQIDLSLVAQQLTANPAQWSNYPVKLTLSNAGPQAATGVKVKFAKPTGVVYVGGNEFTASQGSFNPNGDEVWTVGSIAANGSASLTVNYFLLNTSAPVAYAQVAAANETDSDSQPNNGTPPTPVEDDEASTSGGTPPPPGQPDLTISDLQISTSSVAAGAILNYYFDAGNAGTEAVPGNFTIKSFISTDQTLSANDVQDGTISTGNYAAGFAAQNVAGAATIPTNLAAGQYYLIVKIDADGVVAEGNESNNTAVKPFTVSGPSTGNCEHTLTPSPMVCAAPLSNGNFEVGTGANAYFTPYQRHEYAANGDLVSNLSDSQFPSIPAFVTIIQNGNSIATLQTSTGAISGVTPLPASITSTMTNLVVCAQSGTSNYFLAGTRTGDNRVLVLLLDNSANPISTLNTNQGGFANSIVATTWGGAILGRANNPTSGLTPGGSLHVISASNALLYSVTKLTSQFSFDRLPCGGENAYRVNSVQVGPAGSSTVQYGIAEDYQFTEQNAVLWRGRKNGSMLTLPLPQVNLTEHSFYNSDGSRWLLTRKMQDASQQYGLAATDTFYYQKMDANNLVLLAQPLEKTKFDGLTSLQIYAVAEVQPGKLAFFGNRNGAAWYYNPFCGSNPPPTGCGAITITPGVGSITIAGFSAPHVLIKVFRPNWTVAYECLDGACANPTVISGLGTGSHYVEVKLLDAGWGEICKKTQTVGVTNIAQQDDRQRLAFDKFYPNPTAYQTTMELYSPVEQRATLDFYDRTGRLVHTQKVVLDKGQNLIKQLVFDWKSGTYNVVARGEETALPAYGRFLKVWEE